MSSPRLTGFRLTGRGRRPYRRRVTRTRVAALDGLRGVAALVVVVHHVLCTNPTWYRGMLGPGGAAVEYSPLHPLLDGTFAVYVFFVLSGVVLPWRLAQQGSLRAFYAQRLLRLYVPVWAALAFSVGLYYLVPRLPVGDLWMAAHAGSGNARALVGAATLTAQGPMINGVLWSLRWEIVFSLLVPLYVLVARRLGTLASALLAVELLGIVAAGMFSGHASLQYLPMFGVGVLLAQHWHRLPELRRLGGPAAGLLLLLASVYWMTPSTSAAGRSLGCALQVLAAAGVVVLAERWHGARSALQRRPVLWLGSRSYSLYLVHEPLVVSVWLLTRSWLLTLVVAVPVGLLAAELFWRGCEQRAHQFARRVGRAVALPAPAVRVPQRAVAAAD